MVAKKTPRTSTAFIPPETSINDVLPWKLFWWEHC